MIDIIQVHTTSCNYVIPLVPRLSEWRRHFQFDIVWPGHEPISTIDVELLPRRSSMFNHILSPPANGVPQVHIVCGANVEFAVGCDRTCTLRLPWYEGHHIEWHSR